ncbi:VirB4 family type IV secretion/conjugal transfer ATPase [Paracraurococcus lichenis]|uniref:CagE TrbE VirB component of type IV transporter system central domain-containing protein n=1 Tax=Paracraurococcus lichenis TaxID=3064888 RepID=A0ABT9E848_9PROT|nr:hypothetical protein [Paracraurococcus sp. LOR1-02]MDO9712353.1 hypothetical protein [Paracraurococcus sp. LOR1-02]
MPLRTSDELLPYWAHHDERTILRDGGTQVRVYQVSGLPWELETNRSIGRLHNRLKSTLGSIAHPNLTIGVHVCKLMEHGVPQAGDMRHTWPRQFDQDYRQHVLGHGLTRNTIYISVTLRSSGFGRLFGGKTGMPTPEDIRRMDEICAVLESDLALYGIAPLGLRAERRRNGVLRWYSQVAEAVGIILYGRYDRVPMPARGSRIGRAILRDRPIFTPGARTIEIRTPGNGAAARYFGTMLGFTAWPEGMEPGVLNGLLSFPGTCVITATFGFKSSTIARTIMKRRQGHAKTAGEEEEDDVGSIGAARKEFHRKEWVLGSMHLSVAVYAPTRPRLNDLTNHAVTVLKDASMSPVQEDLNLEAAWAAQAPGCWHKIARRDNFTSLNFAAVAPLHNYPPGDDDPLWGDYVADFRTTGGTLYRHNLHRGEVGSTLLLGMTGEGKSVLACVLLLGAVERLNARGIMFDKDQGSKPCILGMGGSYLTLRYGVPSGLAPLKAARNTPEDHGHLVKLFTAAINAKAPEDFAWTPEEVDRLNRAIAQQLRMPPAMRSWACVRQIMGWRNNQGAGAWLEPWCEGGTLGWVFANERDEVDLTRRCAGFDTTALLEHPEVCGPILADLSWRVRRLATGEPLFLYWDELAQALKIPEFEDIIGDNLSTIRKKNGVVVMASQSPGALLASKIGDVIKQQTPTKISFANKEADWDEYQAIGFTPVMFRMVTQDFTRGPKRFVISRAGASVVLDFDLSSIKQHLWMLSGRSSTGDELDRIIAEVGPDPEAWVPIFLQRAPQAHARAMAEAARQAAKDAERAKQPVLEAAE